jgi:Putative 3TM holin, Phage_holin_3
MFEAAWPTSYIVEPDMLGLTFLWSFITVLACIAIVVRLLTYRRGDAKHRHAWAWVSWLYIAGCTLSAVKVALGVRPPPGPAEALLCAAAAAAFLYHRGNLAHAHRALAAFLYHFFKRSAP